ncbi:oxygen-independent coproporphyrinogen III oxidase [Candidatus Thiomargarita nelsonii]|uniref:Oxygen-independent coproporphyrinogen III oxidase n=1 Tax=Candidatus Thiomargarita nelsonii TaxID=1003181 RepID=A0A0A6RLG1_9GAMM|nr:oxygen-independent coproporphyrinogen III oxidase [Candidatus Thiomargarita nelsonii]
MNIKAEESYVEPSRKGFVTNYPSFQYWKKSAVEEMLTEKPISVYVHIPFCIQRCAYCYYRTITLKGSERPEIDRYVDAVCREIEIAAKRFHLKDKHVVSIYFGGGTPTLLKEGHLSKIIECLHENLSIDDEHEFTVEAEPVTLTEKKADILKKFDVNRISLGIQSFCDEVVKLSGRKDTEKKALKAIEMAKATGAVVNIDLLSGLAGDTQETWADTIKRALSTNIESITVYKMELYANTAYSAGVRKKTLELPSDAQEIEFMRYAIEQFEQAQYFPWSSFTFTKMGHYVHTYPINMFRGNDYYGFGASAFGFLGDYGLLQNTNDLERYVAAVEANELPLSRGYQLTSLERMIRNVALEMKLVRLDLKEFQRKHGFKLDSLCASTIKQLELEGFISTSEKEIELTSKGILYGDYVGKRLTRCLMEMS